MIYNFLRKWINKETGTEHFQLFRCKNVTIKEDGNKVSITSDDAELIKEW